MSLNEQITSILESVQDGNSLTSAQYEILAESSESETISAVGLDGAAQIESAYSAYVQSNIINNMEN